MDISQGDIPHENSKPGSKKKHITWSRADSRELLPDSLIHILFPPPLQMQPEKPPIEEIKKEEILEIQNKNPLITMQPVNFDDNKLEEKNEIKKKVIKKSAIKRIKPEKAFATYSPIHSDDDEESKKTKQERNRLCARECRLRKKVYLESMEAQVKILRKELAECRKELEKYKEQANEKILEKNNIMQKAIDPFKKFLEENKETKTEIYARDLIKNYIVFL